MTRSPTENATAELGNSLPPKANSFVRAATATTVRTENMIHCMFARFSWGADMVSLLEIEAAIHAYHAELGEQLEPGGKEFGERVKAMQSALEAAAKVRAEEANLIQNR